MSGTNTWTLLKKANHLRLAAFAMDLLHIRKAHIVRLKTMETHVEALFQDASKTNQDAAKSAKNKILEAVEVFEGLVKSYSDKRNMNLSADPIGLEQLASKPSEGEIEDDEDQSEDYDKLKADIAELQKQVLFALERAKAAESALQEFQDYLSTEQQDGAEQLNRVKNELAAAQKRATEKEVQVTVLNDSVENLEQKLKESAVKIKENAESLSRAMSLLAYPVTPTSTVSAPTGPSSSSTSIIASGASPVTASTSTAATTRTAAPVSLLTSQATNTSIGHLASSSTTQTQVNSFSGKKVVMSANTPILNAHDTNLKVLDWLFMIEQNFELACS